MSIESFYKGKVRDLYNVDNPSEMLVYTSDRISVFDVVLNEKIEGKGMILNDISTLWMRAFEREGLTQKFNFKTHLISENQKDFPVPFCNDPYFKDRSVYVKKGERINFECIVRGYLAGSAWEEYKNSGGVGENPLPKNIKKGAKLEQAIFTPSTKERIGTHDLNVPFSFMEKELGKSLSKKLKNISLAIFDFATMHLKKCNFILADTKFEFALLANELLLIDEVLTPDSSRYWSKKDYEREQKKSEIPLGFDKQLIRNYILSTGWDKKSPPPPLSKEVIHKTMDLYKELQKQIHSILI